MLTIDYDPTNQAAVLEASDAVSPTAWADVRRICHSRGQDARSYGGSVLSLPWWSFLTICSDLLYVFHKHHLPRQFTERAHNLLHLAREREEAYRSATTAHQVDKTRLPDLLAAAGFTRELKEYQVRNVLKLLQYPAAATFSVPGAGKTTEALAFFALKRQRDTRLLVVAPRNAFAAWEEQTKECFTHTSLTVRRLEGGQIGVRDTLEADPTISLITYQQLPNVLPTLARHLTRHPYFMYLDESHRMKRGHAGVHGAAILRLAHLPVCKLILSGTPIPNDISDLTPQFGFLYPEVSVTEENVVQAIQRVYVRTTKDELGLQPVSRLVHPVRMLATQQRLYGVLASEAARQLHSHTAADRVRLRSFGRCVIRLLQVCTDPALLTNSDLADHPLLSEAISEGVSPKVLEACRLARGLAQQGRKCIIWSQFVATVEFIARLLREIGAEYIHGGVEVDADEDNTDSREAKIQRFHDDPACMVLVANPAACSEGISLHRVCHHAIYVDRSYNAAQYLQSEDRIHRLGLPPHQSTIVTLLQCPETIDDSVARRLQAKAERMRTVLNDPGLSIEPAYCDEALCLTEEDLEDLRSVLLRCG